MKKKQLSILVASMAISALALPVVGQAVDLTSDVEVNVGGGSGTGPSEENISTKPPVDGPFVIKSVSDFDFVTIPIGETRAAKLPEDKGIKYDSGIEVVDETGAGTGWNVKVAMTTPLKTTDAKKEELKGWSLAIPSKEVTSKKVVTTDAVGVPVTLTKDASKTVFKASAGKGMGRYTNIFERYADSEGNSQQRANGVKLSIPNTARAAKYTGILTWTLTNTPEA